MNSNLPWFTVDSDGRVVHRHSCKEFAQAVAKNEGLRAVPYSRRLNREWLKKRNS